ncbi:MAG: hypothetical protein ACRDJN_11690 [Chloroflexota bacterium]
MTSARRYQVLVRYGCGHITDGKGRPVRLNVEDEEAQRVVRDAGNGPACQRGGRPARWQAISADRLARSDQPAPPAAPLRLTRRAGAVLATHLALHLGSRLAVLASRLRTSLALHVRTHLGSRLLRLRTWATSRARRQQGQLLLLGQQAVQLADLAGLVLHPPAEVGDVRLQPGDLPIAGALRTRLLGLPSRLRTRLRSRRGLVAGVCCGGVLQEHEPLIPGGQLALGAAELAPAQAPADRGLGDAEPAGGLLDGNLGKRLSRHRLLTDESIG